MWSAQNGIQVFHIGIDPFRADGERREMAHENEFTPGCLQIRRISSGMLMDGI